MFFQGVMDLSGGDGEGSCRIGASHTISTTSILSNHSSTLVLPSTQNSEKSEKSNCFFPSYQQLALNSLRIQSPSTISTPISKFNFFDDISKHLFFYPSNLLSWTLFLASTQSHSPFISLSAYQRTTPSLSQWLPFCYFLLYYILYSLSSYTYSQTSPQSFLFPLFPITASSNSHISYHSESPSVSIHSPYYFLSSRKKSQNPKKVKFHFILPMASFHRKNLPSNNCFP